MGEEIVNFDWELDVSPEYLEWLKIEEKDGYSYIPRKLRNHTINYSNMVNEYDKKLMARKLGNKRQAELGKNTWINKGINTLKKWGESKQICKGCQKPMEYAQRRNDYCSRSCAAYKSNESRIKVVYCATCKKRINRTSNGWYAKFCSHSCAHKKIHTTYIDRWLDGKEDGIRGNGVSDRIKRWLKEKYGDRCSKCGWGEKNTVTGLVPIHVDHIDGNWKNNRPENLRLLCPNCHSLTPNYGSLNKGKGRPHHYKLKYLKYVAEREVDERPDFQSGQLTGANPVCDTSNTPE